jgi:adenosylcobyric acid synthase
MLEIVVVRLPYLSNYDEFDALAAEPSVHLRFAAHPDEFPDHPALVILPGTKSTLHDLAWLWRTGLAAQIRRLAAGGCAVFGICGGYQMLGERIDDTVESRAGTVAGLGLLPLHTVFSAAKTLARPERVLPDGTTVTGYEIHHGRVSAQGGTPFFADQGCRLGAVAGTTWHGLFENDAFRRSYLSAVALACGRDFAPSPDLEFESWRLARVDAIADLVDEHLDTAALLDVLEGRDPGPPRLDLTLRRKGGNGPADPPAGTAAGDSRERPEPE